MKHTASYKNENSLSYTTYGDSNGCPILIHHGMIASIDDGDLFQRLMQAGRYLICAARPGYGESSPHPMRNIAEWADIVSVLIDELKLSQFDILGMSSGAPYSYALGYKFPDRVRNIYIFSGTPALHDEKVLAHWPYAVDKNAGMAELEKLAHALFFSNLSEADLQRNDIKDSLMNNCFGIALDLKLRCRDWGFNLSEVKPYVHMQHSRLDPSVPFITAQLTSELLPNCTLEIREDDVHFSNEALDDFLRTAMIGISSH